MRNRFYILLVFCLFSKLFAQSGAENFDLSYPEFIPENTSFELSIITSKTFSNASKLKLYFIPGNKLEIEKISLKAMNKNANVQFSNTYINELKTSGYKSVINLNDTSFTQDNFFQVVIRLKPNITDHALFKFLGVFTDGDSVLGYLNSSGRNLRQNGKNLITAGINFYRPQENSDKALSFANQSKLTMSLENIESNKLLTEFWFKPGGNDITFFKIKNLVTGISEIELDINSFQMLTASTNNAVEEFINPLFLSIGSWYHIDVEFLPKDEGIVFYCNDIKFCRINLNDFSKPEQYSLIFENNNLGERNDKPFQIDLLRFINLGNSPEVAFSNKNYNDFLSDSSNVIYMFRFADEQELQNSVNYFSTSYNNVMLVNSDAPIFARAPDLNISIMSNSYELSWSGGDYKQAEKYLLEKSPNGSDFSAINTQTADNEPSVTYSAIDPKDENTEIVFYRVKQINKDGSVVYSASVKVGQGTTEPFSLGQNFPNPFNPKTSIEVNLLEDIEVTITVYNLEGRQIEQLFKGTLSKGIHKFSFDATNLPSGIYLYKVATPNYTETRKMVLTK